MSEGRKVVIIDDNPLAVESLETLFVYEGYKVITASTGETGLKEVIKEKPDIVILDIMLPDMDGIQVCEKIKTNPVTGNVKVLMLTAYDTDESFDKSIMKKADWYMVKPFNVNYLLKIVNKLLKGEI